MSARYCVVIPAFNAGKTVGELVRQVKLQGLPVLVVDDGSQDQTAAIAAAKGAMVISHLRNEGKGSALRTGFAYAMRSAYDAVITMDGDGQHDPAEIPRLIQAGEHQHAGIVLGNRMAGGNTMPSLRRWTNWLMSRIVSSLSRQQIPDSQCGLRLIRREVLASVALTAHGFDLETELLLAAGRQRWKTISVPVRAIYSREASHIRPLRDGLRFVRVVARYAARGGHGGRVRV